MLLALLLFVVATVTVVDAVFNAAEYLKHAEPNQPRPPVVLIPGLVSSRLIAWKRKQCRGPDIQIQDVVWLNLAKLMETMTYDKTCWIECLKLGTNATDPKDCKVRADEGLSAIGELSPGNLYTPPSTSIFTALIKMLASELGYDGTSMFAAPFDWRLAPVQLETRDAYFSNLKRTFEVAVQRHRRPAIVIAHSMGTNLFMYFCDWLRVHDKPAGGWARWVRKHVWAYIGIAAPLLGSPGALKSVMSGHTFGLTISEAQARELELTFASTHFLNPRSSRHLDGRKCPNRKLNVTSDYREPIVTIKSATGGSSVSFGIGDVQNGEIFRWVGSMYKEPLMLEKYDALQSLYMQDPLRPLEKLYRRPPIKNVVMIYGTDMPTEIAYTYRIADGAAPGPPLLDEVYYEEPCRAAPDGGGGGSGEGSAVSRPHLDPKGRGSWKKDDDAGAAAGDGAAVCAADGGGAAAGECTDDGNGDGNGDGEVPWRDLASEFSPISDSDLASEPLLADAANFSIGSAGAVPVTAVRSALALMVMEEEGLALPGDAASPEHGGSGAGAGAGAGAPAACRAEVYAMQLKKSVLGSGPSRTGRRSRRFVRHTEQAHSGDSTVPYVSLSFAHTWLYDDGDTAASAGADADPHEGGAACPSGGVFRAKTWTESRQDMPPRRAGDNDNNDALYEGIVGAGKGADPPVDLFHSRRANGDRTVVIEVRGVDHLDIAKHPYAHYLMFEALAPHMAEDLCLDARCQREAEAEAARRRRAEGVAAGPPAYLAMFGPVGEAVAAAAAGAMAYLEGLGNFFQPQDA